MKNILLLLFLFATSCLYAQTATPPLGSGTSSDPYQIASLNNLYWVSQNSSSWNSYYIQTADINAADTKNWISGKGFSSIGDSITNFTGHYNGQGHIIDSLYINTPSKNYVGLFGLVNNNDTTLKNLGVTHANITGKSYVGVLTGSFSSGTANQVWCSGSVTGNGNYVGGLSGAVQGNLSNIYSTTTVIGNDTVGGLAGYNSGTISNAYCIGSVSGNGTITGAFIGDNEGTVTHSFWDSWASNIQGFIIENGNSGAISLNANQMQNESLFVNAGWDFQQETKNGTADIWGMNPAVNGGYPFLSVQGDTNYAVIPSGSGTISDPYQIATLNNLYWLSQADSIWQKNKYFIQTADINAAFTRKWNSGRGFYPIGDSFSNYFAGDYNGKGYVIDSLYISRIKDHSSNEYTGLFGYISLGAFVPTIKNLGLTNVRIKGFILTGGVAAQFGAGGNRGIIDSCYVSGYVSSVSGVVGGLIGIGYDVYVYNSSTNCTMLPTARSVSSVGGLIGTIQGKTLVYNCHSTGSITATDTTYGGGNGGLIGQVNGQMSIISHCYSIVNISGLELSHCGGLVGSNKGVIEKSYATGVVRGVYDVGGLAGANSGNIVNSYATGNISCTSPNKDGFNDGYDFGGLVGANYNNGLIKNSYAIGSVSGNGTYGGGLVGANAPTGASTPGVTSASFWNTETSGYTTSAGGTGKTTTEMQNESTYKTYSDSTWDFSNTWAISSTQNNGYPYLLPEKYIVPMAPLGSGTQDAPYHIASLENLYWVSQNMGSWSGYFIQTTNINAADTKNLDSGNGFTPIGDSINVFGGSYDGQGYYIDSLYINRPTTDYVGLFGVENYGASDESTKNLSIINANIVGKNHVGILTGNLVGNYYPVSSIYTSGTVTGKGNYVGGISGSVTGKLSDVYSTASVSGNDTIGGLTGYNTGTISNSYFNGSVSGNGHKGLLVGDNEGTLSNLFWDSSLSGTTPAIALGTIAGVTSKTTAEMRTKATFTDAGWDFQDDTQNGTADVWGINPNINNNYPFLSMQDHFSHYSLIASSGTGTASDPYQIKTLENLYWLSKSDSVWNKHFIQTANINAGVTKKWVPENGFSPIGDSTMNFTGVYNGQGYDIDSLHINLPSNDYIGLFGKISQKNDSVKNLSITHADIKGNNHVGILAGNIADSATVNSIYTSGILNGNGKYMGGIAGTNMANLSNVYSTAYVSGNDTIGGLTGYNAGSISNSYFIGTVTGNGNTGELIGNNKGTLKNLFWDSSLSGSIAGIASGTTSGATGETTANMKTKMTFTDASWDFQDEIKNGASDLWGISPDINNNYPFLSMQDHYSNYSLIAPAGSGTSTDPYQIASLENLYWISQNKDSWSSKYFIQTADIDAAPTKKWNSGKGFTPIGNSNTTFGGAYNGQGYSIDSLYINRPSTNFVGLFGVRNYENTDAAIKNLSITHADITGNNQVGILAGDIAGSAQVNNINTSGLVTGNGSYVGGISGSVTGKLSDVYSTASVSGNDTIGGLTGYNTGTISNSYFIGSVTGNNNKGVLIGNNEGNLSNLFWDSTLSGTSPGIASGKTTGAMGKVTADMQNISTFANAGWNVHSIWSLNKSVNGGYPYLLATFPTGIWTGDISSNWNNAGNWQNSIIPDSDQDITIPGNLTNYPVIDSVTNITSYKVTLNSGAVFDINRGGMMTITNSLVNNGTFKITADSMGYGSLIIDKIVGGDGTFIKQQYMPNDSMLYMISSPSQNDTIVSSDFVPAQTGGMLSSNFDFYSFDQSQTNSWINIRNSDATVNSSFEEAFTPGKGYLVSYTPGYGKKVMDFKGPFNAGDVTAPTLTYNSNSDLSGWNLLGNPYTSAIDWSKADLTMFTDNFAYIYNPNKPGGAGYIEIDGTKSGAYIAPGQAFFVHVNMDNSGKIFTFTNSLQLHKTMIMLKGMNVDTDKIVLKLSSGMYYDQTTIRVMSNSQNVRDRDDALKLQSLDTTIPQFYSYTSDSVKVALNTYPSVDSINDVQLGIYIPSDGTYTIGLPQYDGVFANKPIVLEDLKNGMKTDLTSENYTFQAQKGNSKRFVLTFNYTTGINNLNANSGVHIYAYNRSIYIQLQNKKLPSREVKIYNMMGQVVYETNIGESSSVVLTPNIYKGIYLVRLLSQNKIISTKEISIH